MLVSSGLVGSWFFNCVISRLRKLLKFPESFDRAALPALVLALALAPVAPVLLLCWAATDARTHGAVLLIRR